jgi:hypothetical protein
MWLVRIVFCALIIARAAEGNTLWLIYIVLLAGMLCPPSAISEIKREMAR